MHHKIKTLHPIPMQSFLLSATVITWGRKAYIWKATLVLPPAVVAFRPPSKQIYTYA